MSYSFNEIEALAKCAAKGAGLPWGLAEDAAFALRWLSAFDMDFATLFISALKMHESDDLGALTPMMNGVYIRPFSNRISPLILGAYFCDISHEFTVDKRWEVKKLANATLLMPFLAKIAHRNDVVVSIEWEENVFATDGVCLFLNHQPTTGLSIINAAVNVTKKNYSNAAIQHIRAQISLSEIEALRKYATKTYAPATEESRKRGAG